MEENLQDYNNEQFQESPMTAQSRAFYARKQRERDVAMQMKEIKLQQAEQKFENYKNGITSNGQTNKNVAKGINMSNANGSVSRDLAGDSLYADYNQVEFSPFASDYFNAKWMGIDFGEVTNKHKDIYGGIDPFSKAKDWENLRRNEQSNAGASINLLTQFIGKTAVNTVGGVVGGFYSLGAAGVQGVKNLGVDDEKQESALNLLFDNSVNRSLDKASESVESGNSVFTSQRARDNAPMGFFSFESVKDMSDAYSFISGAVASELIIDAFSGGVGLAGLPGRIASKGASLLNKAEGVAKSAIGLGKTTKMLGGAIGRSEELAKVIKSVDFNDMVAVEQASKNLGMTIDDFAKARKSLDLFDSTIKSGRGLVTGTFWEAGLEARHTKDDLIADQTERLELDMENMSFNSDEEKRIYREDQVRKITDAANSAGMITFGLNTAVLGASNYVQFPTIFGGSKTTSLNSMTGKLDRKNLLEYAKKGKALDIAKTFGRALKAPATEFMEETAQGTINIASKSYYETQLGTRSSSGELTAGVANISDSLYKGLQETYGSEAGRHEGYIGAIVGAIGIPLLKRNSKGKLRSLEMTGGIAEAIRDNKQRNIDINDSLSLMNKQEFGSLLSYNKDNAIISSIDAKKSELAEIEGDKNEVQRLNDNKIFRHVKERLDKGLESYMKQDVKDLIDMDLEDYKTKFQKEDNFSEENKHKELLNFAEKVDIYSDAYKKVYSGLRMDSVNNNVVSKKLFDTLVYAVANEKIYSKEQSELVDKILSNKNINLNKEELIELAKLDDKFKDHQKSIDDIINNGKKKKLSKFEEKKSKLTSKLENLKKDIPEDRRQLLDEVLNNNQDTRGWLESIVRLKDELDSEVYKELADSAIAMFSNENDIKIYEDLLKDLESNKEDLISYKNTKLIPGVPQKNKETASIIQEISDKISKSSRESLDILRGKKDSVTKIEIEKYIELKERAKEGIKLSNKNKETSILDDLNNDEEGIEEAFERLSNITKHKVMAVEIASNLYGFDKLANSYGKIINATFKENIKNIKDDVFNGIVMLNTNPDENELSKLAEELRISIDNLKSDLKEYEESLKQEFIDDINKTITFADNLREDLLKKINLIDKQEESIEKTIKDNKSEQENNEILNIENKVEERETYEEEYDNTEEGKVSTVEFDNSIITPYNSKNLHTIKIDPVSDKSKLNRIQLNRQEFQEKLESGEISYNSATTMSVNETEEDGEEFKEWIKSVGLDKAYLSGKSKVSENPELILKDQSEMDPDVTVYISYFPASLKIYDKQVKTSEGKQFFKLSEDDSPVHELIQFVPLLDVDKNKIDKFKKDLTNAEILFNKQLKDIDSSKSSDERKVVEKATLTRNFERFKEDLYFANQSTLGNINDSVLFSMRQALLNSFHGETSLNELKMRLGGINEGYFEKSGDLSNEVEEFGLTNDNGNPNFLVDSISSLEPDMILFGNQSGVYVDFDGNKLENTKKLNQGSLVVKSNAITGAVYFKYTTVNNRQVPVMLNMSKLGSQESLVEEIMFQIKAYLKNKDKKSEIKINNQEFSFLRGKTYEQFFDSFFKKNRSSTGVLLNNDTLNIDSSGDIRFGTITDILSDVKALDDEKYFQKIKDTISGYRFFLNSKAIRTKGEINKEFFEYIFKNNLVNHSFHSSENNDSLFLKEKFDGTSFNKSAQFHVLNSESNKGVSRSNPVKLKTVNDTLRSLFGRKKNAKKNLTWLDAINGLNFEVEKEINILTLTMDNPVEMLNIAIDNVLSKKIEKIKEAAIEFPQYYTENIEEMLENSKSIELIDTDKTFDKYMKIIYSYKKKIKNNKDAAIAFYNHSQNKNYDINYKKILLSSAPVKIMLDNSSKRTMTTIEGVETPDINYSFDFNEALTTGSKEENKEKFINIIDAFEGLKDSALIIKNIATKNKYNKDGSSKVFINHNKKFSYRDKKTNKLVEISTNNKYKINEEGKVIHINDKGVSSSVDDTNSFNLSDSDSYMFEGKSVKNETVVFSYEDSNGDVKTTNNPKTDFTFNEDGTLKNGYIYLNMFNKDGKRERQLVLIGTNNSKKSNNYLSVVAIPGLNSDFTKDQASTDALIDLSLKTSEGYKEINKSIKDKINVDNLSIEESEENLTKLVDETEEDDDLNAELENFKKAVAIREEVKTTEAIKAITQADKETKKSVDDLLSSALDDDMIDWDDEIDADIEGMMQGKEVEITSSKKETPKYNLDKELARTLSNGIKMSLEALKSQNESNQAGRDNKSVYEGYLALTKKFGVENYESLIEIVETFYEGEVAKSKEMCNFVAKINNKTYEGPNNNCK